VPCKHKVVASFYRLLDILDIEKYSQKLIIRIHESKPIEHISERE
jgi:hypothetical protein